MQVMDLVWKCFSVMLFLVIIYIYVWIDPTTISNRHSIKIDENDSYSDNKTNSMVERKRRDYKYRTESIRSVNESFILTRKKWKTKRRFKDENNRSKPLIHPALSTKRKTHVMTFDIRNGKRTYAKQDVNSYKTLNAQVDDKTSCMYYFDKVTLAEARKTLSLPYNFMLYYIKITTEIFTNSEADNLDDLLHWQYILKGEQFLVQLPVDIDLITFGLLFADHEETVIQLTLYSNSNCTATITDAQNSIRILLWNELLGNNSEYYLCNRKYEEKCWREFQYILTTIWVGYDLSCWSSKDDSTNITFEKDRLPLVAPVLSYLLSFHFVWIFVVLDIGTNTQQSSNTATVYYKRNDRPFGLKRFFTKILHGKCSSCCESSNYCTPSKRLIFLLWFIILLPLGCYRTMKRNIYSDSIYGDVSSVLRLSEPLLFYAQKNKMTAFVLDVVYAALVPIFLIYFGKLFEKSGVLTKNRLINTVSSREHENDDEYVANVAENVAGGNVTNGNVANENVAEVNNKLVTVDLLLSSCYQICSSRKESDGNCAGFLAFCRCINNLIGCAFPIHHLVCELSHMSAVNFIEFLIRLNLWCRGKENQRSVQNTQLEEILTDRNEQNCNEKKESTWKTYVISVIFFIILWIVLRPVISTFTFIIRSFTYFVFVTLPTREHIMRYTLIAVTTVTQFSKYLHEVINMNQEILDYMLEVDATIGQNKFPICFGRIEEKKFNQIYWELKFVKRTLYFLFLKMFIIFMYIFITIETLITYPKSLDGSFQNIIGFLLLIIGPYAISLFFKANQETFLTDENKFEIRKAYRENINKNKSNPTIDYALYMHINNERV